MPRDNQAYPPVSIAVQGCQNVVAYRGEVRRENREKLLEQTSMVMWFTGLSGSGKSTIAHAVEERLHAMGRLTYVFDGDNVRQGLCRDLSFSSYYYEYCWSQRPSQEEEVVSWKPGR
ncbi:adenylyl-sulfate kinase [Desulfonatronum thioautotrophicum]|uniref:adenylyl-sulfate kinase n=1 Tax=Desulfonatronum thioautotrophicum TaxID=617001 RepID=UPI000AEA9150|nr:adenylyl-sulfate kinase [Desulfonatronum thioautotrophicum]